jgi:hypothetical protein
MEDWQTNHLPATVCMSVCLLIILVRRYRHLHQHPAPVPVPVPVPRYQCALSFTIRPGEHLSALLPPLHSTPMHFGSQWSLVQNIAPMLHEHVLQYWAPGPGPNHPLGTVAAVAVVMSAASPYLQRVGSNVGAVGIREAPCAIRELLHACTY